MSLEVNSRPRAGSAFTSPEPGHLARTGRLSEEAVAEDSAEADTADLRTGRLSEEAVAEDRAEADTADLRMAGVSVGE